MVVSDRKNDTSNDFSIVVGETTKKFGLHFKVENMKIVNDTYEVKISRKLLSQFKSCEYDLTYYIKQNQILHGGLMLFASHPSVYTLSALGKHNLTWYMIPHY